MPAPPAPSPVPTTSLAPCAQSTLTVAHVTKVVLPERVDDMSMGSRLSTLTPSQAAPLPCDVRTNADFLKSFPQSLTPVKPLRVWLGKFARRKLPSGHLVMAVKTAGHKPYLHMVQFTDFICQKVPYYIVPPCASSA
jgi:hypothetical protein